MFTCYIVLVMFQAVLTRYAVLVHVLGYGKGYKYNPNFTEPVDQDYFPDELVGTNFFS